jgi:hypothetical protein
VNLEAMTFELLFNYIFIFSTNKNYIALIKNISAFLPLMDLFFFLWGLKDNGDKAMWSSENLWLDFALRN